MAEQFTDPSVAFVTDPYVVGSDRTSSFFIETEDANGVVKAEDLFALNDRLEIHISPDFQDPQARVLRFTSDGAGIVKSATVKGQFDWTISRQTQLGAGDYMHRCWRIVSPGTANELHLGPLWEEPFIVKR